MKRQTPSAVTYLHPDVAQQVAAAEAKHQKVVRHYARKHKQRWHRICAVGLFFVLILAVQSIRMSFALTENQQKLVQARQNYTAAQEQHQQLSAHVDSLKDDTYMQQLLRDKYGYSKNDETIYRLPVD